MTRLTSRGFAGILVIAAAAIVTFVVVGTLMASCQRPAVVVPSASESSILTLEPGATGTPEPPASTGPTGSPRPTLTPVPGGPTPSPPTGTPNPNGPKPSIEIPPPIR